MTYYLATLDVQEVLADSGSLAESSEKRFEQLLQSQRIMPAGLIDPAVFQQLQGKLDDDSQTRDRIRDIVQELEKHGREVSARLFCWY